MKTFSPTESVTLFWRGDMEKLTYRPESRHFAQANDAIIWAFENLKSDQRWSAYLRIERDHSQIRLQELESAYKSLFDC